MGWSRWGVVADGGLVACTVVPKGVEEVVAVGWRSSELGRRRGCSAPPRKLMRVQCSTQDASSHILHAINRIY